MFLGCGAYCICKIYSLYVSEQAPSDIRRLDVIGML